MKPARLRPQAKRDRLAEIKHYREVAGGRVAETLVLATEHALDLLEHHPSMGSPVLGRLLGIPELRAWRITGFPLMWFYVERVDHLDVLRLLGERQDVMGILAGEGPLSLHEPTATYLP
jgi:toxin ParE1/3/4